MLNTQITRIKYAIILHALDSKTLMHLCKLNTLTSMSRFLSFPAIDYIYAYVLRICILVEST